MVQQSLVNYIREQIRAGYDANTIQNYLLKYGYSRSQVNEAMQSAYPPAEVKHVVHPSHMTIVLIAAIVCSLVLISLGIFMYLIPDKAPAQLLDVKTSILTPEVRVGEKLQFNVELYNLGKARRYDVPLRYEIYNIKDEFMLFEEETIAIETKATSSFSIQLGGIAPGNYYLRTIASYGKKEAKATSNFKVAEKGIVPELTEEPAEEQIIATDRCPASCNDGNTCTTDHCDATTNYQCMHDKAFPCCGNGVCEGEEDYHSCISDCSVPAGQEESLFEGKTIWDKIEIIKGIAKWNKEKASGYCKEIEQTGYRYDCFVEVAVASGDDAICINIDYEPTRDDCYKRFATALRRSDVCAKISKDSKKDQCYTGFFSKGDYTVCDKLVNKYLKQSCESLKKLSEAKAN